MLATSLVRNGVLGEIVHCHGAYSHDLRDEILGGNVNRHYRLENYRNRNCENYPTHELGPIAKLLDINRGNRMVSLSSFASKSVGLTEFSYSDKNPAPNLKGAKFRQGDVITTVSQNPNAIGYASLSAVKDTVKALSVGGVAPSEDTVTDGTYVIQRPFVLVTKDGVTLSPAAQAFLDYAMSDEVAEQIAIAGAVAP